jgi:predicted AAA+ superfamily ATPase
MSFRDYVAEWVGRVLPRFVMRELEVPARFDRAVSIIGPRRAGKTYYFYQLIEPAKQDSLYLNFEDTRLIGISYRELRSLVRVFEEITGRPPVRIFLDEVQNVERWESAVRELLDTGRYQIYVTGSSSKLLSRELATQLRGRAFSYFLLPFSFREYLSAKKAVLPAYMSLDDVARLQHLLREYLEYGGFPEVVFEEVEKDRILKEYTEMMLYKDVVERHRLRSLGLAKFLLGFFLQNFAREFSVNKVLRVVGEQFGKNTVYSYVDKVRDSVAVFFVDRFSERVYQRMSWPKKVYLCDTGLSRVGRFSVDLGRLMENAVFLHLLRLSNRRPLMEVFYWRDLAGYEVDFMVREGVETTELIQVTYAAGFDEIDRREIRGLLKAAEATGCRNLRVVTWDYEDEKGADGYTIYFTPLWKTLLG